MIDITGFHKRSEELDNGRLRGKEIPEDEEIFDAESVAVTEEEVD